MLLLLPKVRNPLFRCFNNCLFSNEKNKRIKVIENPADISKLIFDERGQCKIYDFKSGENTLRKISRYVTMLTFINGTLFGMELSRPS